MNVNSHVFDVDCLGSTFIVELLQLSYWETAELACLAPKVLPAADAATKDHQEKEQKQPAAAADNCANEFARREQAAPSANT